MQIKVSEAVSSMMSYASVAGSFSVNMLPVQVMRYSSRSVQLGVTHMRAVRYGLGRIRRVLRYDVVAVVCCRCSSYYYVFACVVFFETSAGFRDPPSYVCGGGR